MTDYSYNNEKKRYADNVSQYEDDIKSLREELIHIEVPEDDCEKHIACFEIRTVIGILPICLNDVEKDPETYMYTDEYACGYEYVDKEKEGKYWIDGKQISISEIGNHTKVTSINKKFRIMQLSAYIDGDAGWKSLVFVPDVLKAF